MRRLLWLLAAAALAGCGGYVFVYLYRWQWNRALLMTAFFVAIEVAMATAFVAAGLRRVERWLENDRAAPDPAVVARVREAAPRRDHFAWLGVRGDRMSVFVTMVVGGGIIVSALAWVLDRLAARTTGRRSEDRLAERLGSIAFPADGLVPDETAALADDAPYEHDPDLALLLGSASRP